MRVLFNGLAEIFDPCVDSLLRPHVPIVEALKISLIGLRIDWAGTRQVRLFDRWQPDFYFIGNGVRDPTLYGQDVAEIALILLGPQVLISCGAHTLRRARYTTSRLFC